MSTGAGIGCGILAVLGVVVLIMVAASGAQVNAGHVGVVSQWGAIDVNQQPLNAGYHPVFPIGTHIESVSIQQQNHSFREVSTASKELQNVYVDGGINYHITAAEAAGISINGGEEAYVQRVFQPAFQDYIKEEVPHYSTTEILSNRAKIRDNVLNKLREKAKDPSVNYHVTVDDLFLTDIHFDKGYTAAIEAAAVSQQKLAQAKVDAQTAAATAKGAADAVVAKAQGDAQATLVNAQAQAQANRELAASVTPALIQYQTIQKWSGALPQVDGSGTNIISITPK